MSQAKELTKQEKKELKTEERTFPTKVFMPLTDIYETESDLVLVMDMPGVTRERVEINLEQNRLSVDGQIDFSGYDDMRPVHVEYNVGHYQRTFTLGDAIDRDKIKAEIKDGVLTLTLPKRKEAKPRKIKIN